MKDLISRRIVLCPIEDKHLPILYGFRNKPSFIMFCTNRKKEISFQEFCEELRHDFQKDRHCQCLIIRKRDNVPIGTIHSYNYNKQDRYAFVTTFINDEFQHAGYGAEAVPLFFSFLFHAYHLYKIYTDVYEYNKASLSVIVGSNIFTEEGRFKKQKLMGRKRYDVIRFACYQRNLRKISKFLRRINKRS